MSTHNVEADARRLLTFLILLGIDKWLDFYGDTDDDKIRLYEDFKAFVRRMEHGE